MTEQISTILHRRRFLAGSLAAGGVLAGAPKQPSASTLAATSSIRRSLQSHLTTSTLPTLHPQQWLLVSQGARSVRASPPMAQLMPLAP